MSPAKLTMALFKMGNQKINKILKLLLCTLPFHDVAIIALHNFIILARLNNGLFIHLRSCSAIHIYTSSLLLCISCLHCVLLVSKFSTPYLLIMRPKNFNCFFMILSISVIFVFLSLNSSSLTRGSSHGRLSTIL